MKYLAVKNYERFQHYKDRSPVWIKLYNALLDDYAFMALSETSQRHLMMLWLLASRLDNRIPNDQRFIAQAIKARGRVDLQAMIAAGFLLACDDENSAKHASNMLANIEHDDSELIPGPEQNASPHARPRARGETEEEIEKRQRTTSSSSARDALYVKIPSGYHADLDRLLSTAPNPDAWIAEITVSLDGMHSVALTPEQLGRAVRDYTANGATPNMRLFRGYLRDAAKPQRAPSGGKRRAPGQYTYTETTEDVPWAK